ncbi:unnamed protein product [Urochloa humidicola]
MPASTTTRTLGAQCGHGDGSRHKLIDTETLTSIQHVPSVLRSVCYLWSTFIFLKKSYAMYLNGQYNALFPTITQAPLQWSVPYELCKWTSCDALTISYSHV